VGFVAVVWESPPLFAANGHNSIEVELRVRREVVGLDVIHVDGVLHACV
jgi:hypothetical protein